MTYFCGGDFTLENQTRTDALIIAERLLSMGTPVALTPYGGPGMDADARAVDIAVPAAEPYSNNLRAVRRALTDEQEANRRETVKAEAGDRYTCEYCGHSKTRINWCSMPNTGEDADERPRIGAQLCDLCADSLKADAIKAIAHDDIRPYRNWGN